MSLEDIFSRHNIPEEKQKTLSLNYEMMLEAIKEQKISVDAETFKADIVQGVVAEIERPEEEFYSKIADYCRADKIGLYVQYVALLALGFVIGKFIF